MRTVHYTNPIYLHDNIGKHPLPFVISMLILVYVFYKMLNLRRCSCRYILCATFSSDILNGGNWEIFILVKCLMYKS